MVKLILFATLVVYLAGIWKLIKGYNYTNFRRQLFYKLILSLFWPILVIFNTPYRHSFQKALKGRE